MIINQNNGRRSGQKSSQNKLILSYYKVYVKKTIIKLDLILLIT